MPWMLIGAVLIIGIASSTKEGRADARKRMRRYNRPLWIINVAIVAAFILGEVIK